MLKLATRKRKDEKKDFGSAPFLLTSSYCFPLRILLLLPLLLVLILKLARERMIFNMIILSSQICKRQSSR
jgi:hypothetical protein